ncbi:I78 family peptidase inhibitor [Marivivens marinus]|uniref:I78 family peptidase inhibitor n=1 Tax=Marivivens marinus TaxID=3110173 RepID=UPI003B84AF02
MKLHRVPFAIGICALAACTQGPAPVPPPAEDTCGAAEFSPLVGQQSNALERQLIMRQVRVIRPGDAVTMDYRPDRLNFEIDSAGQIARIFCG